MLRWNYIFRPIYDFPKLRKILWFMEFPFSCVNIEIPWLTVKPFSFTCSGLPTSVTAHRAGSVSSGHWLVEVCYLISAYYFSKKMESNKQSIVLIIGMWLWQYFVFLRSVTSLSHVTFSPHLEECERIIKKTVLIIIPGPV